MQPAETREDTGDATSQPPLTSECQQEQQQPEDDHNDPTNLDIPEIVLKGQDGLSIGSNMPGEIRPGRGNPGDAVPRPLGGHMYNLDGTCGVKKPDGERCKRALTCKAHSMAAKRGVEGRSAPFDFLLACYMSEIGMTSSMRMRSARVLNPLEHPSMLFWPPVRVRLTSAVTPEMKWEVQS
jgi:hypothetical protein